MKLKKQHVIAPKKSDAKKMNKDTSDSLRFSKPNIRKKLNEFGDTDSL